MTPAELATLDREHYLLVTTYKRDGTAKPTPVWFARDGDQVVFYTEADAAKVKRIRATTRVTVQPCSARGTAKAGTTSVEGRGILLDGVDAHRAELLLRAKYGWRKRGFEAMAELVRRVRRRPEQATTYVAVRFDTPDGGSPAGS